MYRSDIRLMPDWKRRLLGIKYEDFDTHVSTLSIKIDQLPNPTKVESQAYQIPVEGERYTATHWPGKLILKSLFKNNRCGPSGLTHDSSQLEIYPLPTELLIGQGGR